MYSNWLWSRLVAFFAGTILLTGCNISQNNAELKKKIYPTLLSVLCSRRKSQSNPDIISSASLHARWPETRFNPLCSFGRSRFQANIQIFTIVALLLGLKALFLVERGAQRLSRVISNANNRCRFASSLLSTYRIFRCPSTCIDPNTICLLHFMCIRIFYFSFSKSDRKSEIKCKQYFTVKVHSRTSRLFWLFLTFLSYFPNISKKML